jgi:hypothetical protein
MSCPDHPADAMGFVGPMRLQPTNFILATGYRSTLLSSVDPSRWTSNHYFRPAMYDLSSLVTVLRPAAHK